LPYPCFSPFRIQKFVFLAIFRRLSFPFLGLALERFRWPIQSPKIWVIRFGAFNRIGLYI